MSTTFDAAVIDNALADLTQGEKTWAATGLRRRRELLEELHALTARDAEAWVSAARTIKQLDADSPLVGEEWMSGPMTMLAGAQALAESLGALERGASPLDGVELGTAPGGRVSVPALPHGFYDKLLLSGFSAEVWLRPGVDAATARRKAGLAQLDPAATGGVGAVLGAGNIMSIAPLDTLYELYANNRVVALKLNPITDPLLPVFRAIFAPFIELGVVRILTGGAPEGGYLVNHPQVAHVHMTGGAPTHDAIVWGAGAEGAERKKTGTPALAKPITSELGGVAPCIVVPGDWSAADLKFQAEHVATQRLHNGGYNCVAAQTVVVSADWPLREQFLTELRAAIDRAPARPAYYPGSDGRVAGALESYPGSARANGRVLVEDLPAGDTPLLRTEYFSPVLGVVSLPGTGADFLRNAVDFANDELMGTLGANIIVDPATVKELGAQLDTAVENLRYGTVAVNAWTGLAFLTPRASWGAFPGHTLDDIQSGIGVVHNAFLLDDVERTVVRGPFRPAPRALLRGEFTLSPKPPWFVTNKTGTGTGRKLTGFYGDGKPTRLPGIFASALRG
ncbi:aldehyde dehydrogenase (NAD(P)+) [Nocardia neocaledoniensis]|uniref:Aldehyde dehydrogenase (NAD(P)+) n=2 Tax=Nocardia neocaledoniensis TaxID=236511 RepID=A0A317NRP1_9NOCA|nr:aldehyde dehydrogenase family protein [Nocardia neocaledoniensis]PWV76408.1 aldehyde dehydrogenase (NAD(P)+) [Nocardia neocaledoniensis]